jgi:glutathione S-transferase
LRISQRNAGWCQPLFRRRALPRATARLGRVWRRGAALADAWQFLNAKDLAIADDKKAAFRDKLQRLEGPLDQEPYFSGSAFGMVDAVFAPVFRYFDVLGPIEATARAELYVEAVEQMQQQVQVMMEAMLKPWAALMAPFVDRNRGR